MARATEDVKRRSDEMMREAELSRLRDDRAASMAERIEETFTLSVFVAEVAEANSAK